MKVIHRIRDEAKKIEFLVDLPATKTIRGNITIVKDGTGYQVDRLICVHTRIDFDTDTATKLYFCDLII